jgi:hypothetical protein
MESTFFTVTPSNLERLDPTPAIEFFSEVLWAEARRVGIPTSEIAISTRVSVPDGGVDARISTNRPLGDSFLSTGNTVFQVKAGSAFKPWSKSDARYELLGGKPETRDSLGEGVRACLESEGRYVLVSTGSDATDSQLLDARSHFEGVFRACGYPSPRVEVWGQNHLIGLVTRFPSLALTLNGLGPDVNLHTHTGWGGQTEMRRPFRPGPAQQVFLDTLRRELRRSDFAVHVRVHGEPGIGKTRLVFEATAADDLKPLVVYCGGPSAIRESRLVARLSREDSAHAVILIVDECDCALGSSLRSFLAG